MQPGALHLLLPLDGVDVPVPGPVPVLRQVGRGHELGAVEPDLAVLALVARQPEATAVGQLVTAGRFISS